MAGVTMLPAVVDTGCDWLVDGFVVGYVTEDGTQQRVPLTDAWAVRFDVAAYLIVTESCYEKRGVR
jgi:hypothetical protein